MTTDEDALRAAVAAHPHDWTPRLVLADYLDDHGTEPHHAEEATRIRQAADPSTPLGRAVAASRRAWELTKTTTGGSTAKLSSGIVSHEVSEYVHDTIHNPDPVTRHHAAVQAAYAHEHHGRSHTLSRTRQHQKAGDAHTSAADMFHEYARTL